MILSPPNHAFLTLRLASPTGIFPRIFFTVLLIVPASVDYPQPGVPFDPVEFWILGWLWLEERHAELAAIEAWHGDTKLGEVSTSGLFERPDVSTRYGIAAGVGTGFAFAAQHSGAPTQPFALSLCGRLRDGLRTAPVVTTMVTPLSPDRDPLGALRACVSRTARGLEIGAHLRPARGLTPYYSDMIARFAGTSGRVDFLADAVSLPLPDDGLDYLCSSHVLEHLPNPLAALHEWHRVIRPGGWLYLVVPDKRYTFDVDRQVTTVNHLLRDFLTGAPPADSAVHIDEFVYQTDWGRLQPDCPAEERSTQQAAAHAEYLRRLHCGEPFDIHFHTFTRDSLEELLRAAGFIGGNRARFELVMAAERYPPARADGIALLLRKRGRPRGGTPAATYALPHVDPAIAPLPLVCPISLTPLVQEATDDGRRVLVAPNSGRRYPFQDSLPALLPPHGDSPERPWDRRTWRITRHLAAHFRLAF